MYSPPPKFTCSRQGDGHARGPLNASRRGRTGPRLHYQACTSRRVADICSRATRSALMARIKASNTKPEISLRSQLQRLGLRFRIHARHLPGTPDVVFGRARVAVFVHGCFWHGCPEHYIAPKTRSAFWRAKVAANRERDERARSGLASGGWRVVELWEHEVEDDPVTCAERVASLVRGGGAPASPPHPPLGQGRVGRRSRSE